MRIAHLTDLHFYAKPKASEMFYLKRLMGTTNLFLLGRKSKFSLQVQRAAIQKAAQLEPDLVIITGDLTSQALDREFEIARAELDPILARIPAVVLPGNHDLYLQPEPTASMSELFGQWMGEGSPHLHQHGDVSALYIETCKPDLLSRGYVDPNHLQKAAALLQQNQDAFTFLCIHYPIWNRHRQSYGPWTRAIENGSQFEQWVISQPIDAVIHGHEHHGFRCDIDRENRDLVVINPGSTGYNLDTKRDRRAHFNLYHVQEGKLESIERFRYTPDGFEAEPGGAYATKR